MIELRAEEDVAELRERLRALASEAGMGRVTAETIVNAASELAHNALRHAVDGTAHYERVERDGVPGIEIEVWDRGPGIADPTAAILGNGGSEKGLGMGLAAARRLADELDLDTRLHEGTRVRIRKFDRPVHAWPEFALFGRPHPDERISGDDGLILRVGPEVLFGVVDGLGHGQLARESSRRTVDALRAHAHADLRTLLRKAHEAARGTRGSAATVGRFGSLSGEFHVCGVGNVMAHLYSPVERRRQVLPRSGVLGGSSRPAVPHPTLLDRGRGDVLVVFSDGLTSATDVDRALLHKPAAVIAHQLVERFWRERDDATVLVVK